MKADRSQFLDHAIELLAHPIVTLRSSALNLLHQIGSERDSAPVVALLSDDKNACQAASTLAAIGGERELTAFDVWLTLNAFRKDDEYQRYFIKCRDILKQRLEKPKAPKK